MADDDDKPEAPVGETLPHDGEQAIEMTTAQTWQSAFNSHVLKWHWLYRMRAGQENLFPGYNFETIEKEMFLLRAHAINTLSLASDDEKLKDFYESLSDFLFGLLRGRFPEFIRKMAREQTEKEHKKKLGRPRAAVANPGQSRSIAIFDAIATLAREERERRIPPHERLIPVHATTIICKSLHIDGKKLARLRKVHKEHGNSTKVDQLRETLSGVAPERRADRVTKMIQTATRRYLANEPERKSERPQK